MDHEESFGLWILYDFKWVYGIDPQYVMYRPV